ncbi:MAG TPA: phage holin family protein [Gammaproteobacteria bacterium]|nr:phage holin family protein [Gammaproteobacteria bacterium]
MQVLFFRLLATAAGLWVASSIVPGIEIGNTSTLFLAAILLGIVNVFVRPFVVILTLPISVLSLGFFLLVINAGMLGIVAWLLDDFALSGFLAAFLGSLIVSIVNFWTTWSVGSQTEIDIFTFRK